MKDEQKKLFRLRKLIGQQQLTFPYADIAKVRTLLIKRALERISASGPVAGSPSWQALPAEEKRDQLLQLLKTRDKALLSGNSSIRVEAIAFNLLQHAKNYAYEERLPGNQVEAEAYVLISFLQWKHKGKPEGEFGMMNHCQVENGVMHIEEQVRNLSIESLPGMTGVVSGQLKKAGVKVLGDFHGQQTIALLQKVVNPFVRTIVQERMEYIFGESWDVHADDISLPDAADTLNEVLSVKVRAENLLKPEKFLKYVNKVEARVMLEDLMRKNVAEDRWDLFRALFLSERRIPDKELAALYLSGGNRFSRLRHIKNHLRAENEQFILAWRLLRKNDNPKQFLDQIVNKKMMESSDRFRIYMDLVARIPRIETERKYSIKTASYPHHKRNIRAILEQITGKKTVSGFKKMSDGDVLALLETKMPLPEQVSWYDDPVAYSLWERKIAIEKILLLKV